MKISRKHGLLLSTTLEVTSRNESMFKCTIRQSGIYARISAIVTRYPGKLLLKYVKEIRDYFGYKFQLDCYSRKVEPHTTMCDNKLVRLCNSHENFPLKFHNVLTATTSRNSLDQGLSQPKCDVRWSTVVYRSRFLPFNIAWSQCDLTMMHPTVGRQTVHSYSVIQGK